MKNFKRVRGFTLLELMVTVAIAAIILSFGVPGFVSFVQNNRAATHTNDLVTALNLGRSEATRRGSPVLLCSSTDGTTCSGSGDWSTGWVVRSAGGNLLRSWPERSGGAGVISGNVSQVQFQPRGSIAGGALLEVRLPDCSGQQGRDVAVNVAGRISVSRVGC
ncbi:MAG: GspH/FimT family pseudopilin [Woeseia sp.]